MARHNAGVWCSSLWLFACVLLVPAGCLAASVSLRACTDGACNGGAPGEPGGGLRALRAESDGDVPDSPEAVNDPKEATIYSNVIGDEMSREQFFSIFLTSLVALMVRTTA